MKEGAKIVSSKAYCPLNFRISDRNLSGKDVLLSATHCAFSPLYPTEFWPKEHLGLSFNQIYSDSIDWGQFIYVKVIGFVKEYSVSQ